MSPLVAPLLDAPPLRRYGLPEYVQGASPAAGAHFVQAITGQYHTRLVSVFARLVTDATAAARTVLVEYRDAEDNRFVFSGAPVTQSASDTIDWAFHVFHSQAEWEIDNSILIPLAPILLPPTFDFRVFVGSIQAGDQLSQVRFVWERFYSDVPLT